MFRVQFYDIDENRIQTAKFKIEENSGGGDCLFKTIHSFLQSNKKKTNYSLRNDIELRKSIVDSIVNEFDSNYLEEIKFNLQNDVPFFSSLDLNDVTQNENLKKNAIAEYEKHMSMGGSCGTIFELNIAAKIFGFAGAIFLNKINGFDCMKFGLSDNPGDELKPKLFILFNGPTTNGHFRLLKPLTVTSFKLSNIIPCGQYSIVNEDASTILIARCDRDILADMKTINQQNGYINVSNSLPCPLCKDQSKLYKNKHGLKIHFSRRHPGESFNSFFDRETQEDNSMTFKNKLCKLRMKVRILKRIPKSARIAVANKLSEIIEECVKTNEVSTWQQLMTFSYYALSHKKNFKITIIYR